MVSLSRHSLEPLSSTFLPSRCHFFIQIYIYASEKKKSKSVQSVSSSFTVSFPGIRSLPPPPQMNIIVNPRTLSFPSPPACLLFPFQTLPLNLHHLTLHHPHTFYPNAPTKNKLPFHYIHSFHTSEADFDYPPLCPPSSSPFTVSPVSFSHPPRRSSPFQALIINHPSSCLAPHRPAPPRPTSPRHVRGGGAAPDLLERMDTGPRCS